MKYPRWNTSPLLFAVVSLAVLLAISAQMSGQDAKPASATPAASESSEKAPVEDGKVWTCPMHPQIHQPWNGRCPICSMPLVPLKRNERALPTSLDQMLTVALQHNPDVRAARAMLLAAEAELDRTRLSVLQKIIAYRERWSARKAALETATAEFRAAEATTTQDDVPAAQKKSATALLAAARRKMTFEQARLKEIEAELPFLLGRQDAASEHVSSDAETVVIRDRLIPMIEQLIQVTTEEYRKGQSELSGMISWSQRLAELKVQTAITRTERIEIVQSHIILLKDMQKMANQRYKAGAATMKDVLAAQIQVAEAELWLAKVKGGSR